MLMQNKIAHSSELSSCLKANSHSPGAGYDYQFLTPWLGQGLLTSSGPRWHGRRKLLTRAFHGHILDQHVAAMQGHVARLCDKLEVHAQEGTTCSLLEGVTSKSTLTSLFSICYILCQSRAVAVHPGHYLRHGDGAACGGPGGRHQPVRAGRGGGEDTGHVTRDCYVCHVSRHLARLLTSCTTESCRPGSGLTGYSPSTPRAAG